MTPLHTRRVYDSLRITDVERSRSSADVTVRQSSLRSSYSSYKSKDDTRITRDVSPPVFTRKLENFTANVGEQAEFACKVYLVSYLSYN